MLKIQNLVQLQVTNQQLSNYPGSGEDFSSDASGFFLGFFAQFSVTETFSIQPELQYSSITDEGESMV